MPAQLRALAESIARTEAPEARRRITERLKEVGLPASDDTIDVATLLQCAYPGMVHAILARPADVASIARGTKLARDARAYRRQALPLVGDLSDVQGVRHGLRVFAAREKLRIAARELMPHAGSDVDVTARELSDLADVCIDIALSEALTWAEGRFGRPIANGQRCPFVVLGMGKLGGRELNAGSDVDLLLLYGTDEGEVVKDGKPAELTLHEYFARVSQRFTSTLDDVTEDGVVWRVDLRLRPEGSRGPLVNSLAAAERYYETWGRTWERAALVRARAVAGDVPFGEEALRALGPFVWRREVNPNLADEMIALVARARVETSSDRERDLKLGRGGIREAEFFVQSLQLVWGGREPTVRSTNTLDALRRLRARGLVTDREGREVADAYLALRRLEHRVQFATMQQTHTLPRSTDAGGLLERIARSLGFSGGAELDRDLDKTRRRVSGRLASLSLQGRAAAREAASPGELDRLYFALDAADETAVMEWLPNAFGTSASPDLARHLLALARRPDFPLGASTRDKYPDLAASMIEALRDAADPEQATRLMAAFFARLITPTVYAKALAEDVRATRRLASLFGASAFLGMSMVGHPELADRMLFGRGAPSQESARHAVDEEIAALPKNADLEEFVGALRRAKGGVTVEVGLADLAGEMSTRACTLVLSALADASLDHATRFAMRERGVVADGDTNEATGLAVIAMGKLGGREIGYGSDLDIFFVYDDGLVLAADASSDAIDLTERFVRTAQRVMRIVSTPHGDGPGYELDTRLRPSGNQGLLVVSLDAFARYHGAQREAQAEDWERQALLKARACAGDVALGQKVIAIAHKAAYERGAPPPEKMHRLRTRMEHELAGERRDASGRARYDLKLGRGGLVDVEFAVQWLQMKYGADPRVRTADTEAALSALETCGYLEPQLAAALREGYRLLRRLEQRLRVLHGTSAQLIEEGAPGLALLARRMGMRDGPRGSASDALLTRFAEVTRDVRAAYLAVLGLPS